ncbi:MAG: hypothetical protein HC877_23320 [Thioploca sp.]|nr:hypothetical protein [Thioploca sp.]
MEDFSWQNILIKKYNNLFRNGINFFEIDEGWSSLLDDLLYKIQEEYNNFTEEEKEIWSIQQIKEKFGGLRFYYTGGNDNIHNFVKEAELKSFKICELTGLPGKLVKINSFWIKTLSPLGEKVYKDKFFLGKLLSASSPLIALSKKLTEAEIEPNEILK